MVERPIIFSTAMVLAILEGRKSQTRRIVKEPFKTWMDGATNPDWWHEIGAQCPYGQPGDVLYVRESAYLHKPESMWYYKATDPLTDSIEYGYKWKPSIHMPRSAARIFLKVKNVRVERLQDITDADARAEGMTMAGSLHSMVKYEFEQLWDKINEKRAPWGSNPWVWVIEFERIENCV